MPIRVHDLRATFVTLALANGRSEAWVSDRTGHRSSNMIRRYQRTARSATELGLGTLGPLDALIPELRAKNAPPKTPGGSNGGSRPNGSNTRNGSNGSPKPDLPHDFPHQRPHLEQDSQEARENGQNA